MNDQITIGVDIGGSHITSAAVNLRSNEILPRTTHSVKIDNKASKEIIFKNWSMAINKTIEAANIVDMANVGFAIPGPFHYKTGVAMFEGGNDKYESLYKVSIPDELPQYIDSENVTLRFLNDATSFGVGVATQGKAKNHDRVVVVTLGTGFGSAFIKDGVPLVNHPEVPESGCLWDKPYKSSIADDYFSTRWCVARYQEISSKKVSGVKEIAEANTVHSRQLFEEFGKNMADFMMPFLKKFQPQILVMGGNVSKASDLFLPTLESELQKADVTIGFEISSLMEDAAIIGSAKLFDPTFWNLVKDDLPNL